jgi:multiple sugar transport system permease protein/raffinose/stachyose/melibiose transport system permease protein
MSIEWGIDAARRRARASTNGRPNNQTRVLELDIYENAFRYQSMGWAAAVSLVLLLVVLVVTLVQMRLLRTRWEY